MNDPGLPEAKARLQLRTACFMFFLAIASPAVADDLAISNARIVWTPGRIPNPAYFRLDNNSPRSVTLTGATSPDFSRIEFKQKPDNDLFQLESLSMPRSISPGDALDFHRGGRFLILFGQSGMVEPDEKAVINFQFVDHPQVGARFTVNK